METLETPWNGLDPPATGGCSQLASVEYVTYCVVWSTLLHNTHQHTHLENVFAIVLFETATKYHTALSLMLL